MPIIGKTYYCGDEGKLKVYNHGTNTWTDKSFGLSSFYDVKADPTNPNTIILGGLGYLSKSVDAGTNFVNCSGNWNTFVPTIYQISYTNNSNVIYAVGMGGVAKSGDSGSSFDRLDSFTTVTGLQCLAIHFINDLVGIASQQAKLYKTSDGGASWLPLYTGNVLDSAFPNDFITSLHLSADESTIIATTARKIFRSIDGGLGFTMVNYYGATAPNMGKAPKYTNIAWSSDNILVVSAGNGNVLYSYNAGASWINTVGMIPPTTTDSKSGSTLFQGFTTSGAPIGFYSSDAEEAIYRLDQLNLTTLTSSVSNTYSKKVFAMTSSVANVTCYLLTPCAQTGNAITASNSELDGYIDTYVSIDGSCFYVTEAEDCNNTIQITYSSLISVDDCNACNAPEPVYAIRDCTGLQPTQYTTEALTPGISGYLGDILYIAGYPNTCWLVVEQSGDTPQAITILNDFGDCAECTGQLPGPPPVYELTNCLDPLTIRYTYNSQFDQAIGLVVHLNLDPDECWLVAQIEFDGQDTFDVSILENEEGVLQIFEDCECCLPTPEPAPIKYTRVIPKPDKKYYQVKQSQCDVTSNTRFAQAYYNLFKRLKYGISAECDTLDINKLWIKKQLSDLAMTADPTACPATPVEPIEKVCPEPDGNPFVAPTYTFGVGDGNNYNQGTFGCTTCLDGSIPIIGVLCPSFNITLDYNILDTIEPTSVYVFSYNGNCIITLGSFISTSLVEGFPMYTMTSANIANAGFGPAEPCLLCAS
jgi:photosystem II stability/assembly factor-like uncharacterized protein